jgi:hypothetical protein
MIALFDGVPAYPDNSTRRSRVFEGVTHLAHAIGFDG